MNKEDLSESVQAQWQNIRRGEVVVLVDDDGKEVEGWDEADAFLMADVGILSLPSSLTGGHAGDGMPPVGYYSIHDDRPDELYEGDFWFTREGELHTVIDGKIMKEQDGGMVVVDTLEDSG